MSDTVQALIVLGIVVAAALLLRRSLRCRKADDCPDCPLKDNCKKRKA